MSSKIVQLMYFMQCVIHGEKNIAHAAIEHSHGDTVLSKSESVEFSLIESVICLFADSSVQKYFSLTNQLISTDVISEI